MGTDNGDHNALFEKVGKLDGLVQGIDCKIDQILESVGGLDKRVRRVENESAKVKGWALGIAGTISVVMGLARELIFKK